MKAINDFRINASDIVVYETGIEIKKFQPVYFTGIPLGSYTVGSVSESVSGPFQTGYYYATRDLSSGLNYFYRRPDHALGGTYWTQDWFYVPSYGSTISFESNLYSVNFGNSYSYNSSKNENSLKLSAQLRFDGVSDQEAKSIVHFYQNNALQDLGGGSGLRPVDINFFQPFTRRVPSYITDISYDYVFDNVNNVTVNVESPFISLMDWEGKVIPHDVNQTYDIYKKYETHDYVFQKEGTITERGAWFVSGKRDHQATAHLSQSYIDSAKPLPPNWTKKFYFKPDMSNSIDFKTKNYKNELDRFFLMQQDSDNPNLLALGLEFNNRSDKEAKAMLYFLEERCGINNFEFNGVPNFTGTKTFFCPRWSHTYNYKDNNSISALFVETLYGLPESASFNTIITPPSAAAGSIDFGYVPSGFAVTKRAYVTNSGDSSIEYTTQPVIIYNEQDPKYIGIYINGENLNGSKFEPFESGYLDYVFYLTDLSYEAGEEIPGFSGPYNYRAKNSIKQYSPETAEEGPSPDVFITGRSDVVGGANFPTGPNSSWMGYNKYFIAFPDYDADNDNLKLQVSWKPPSTGYFFETFEVEISESSAFTPSTGNTVSVERAPDSLLGGNIYGSVSGLAPKYSSSFGNLTIESTYYVRTKGVNTTYGASSVWSHATGLWGEDYTVTNTDVINGITGDLSSISIPIVYNKIFETIYLNDATLYNIDVYDVIRQNGTFKTKMSYYSGINIIIGPNSVVGSRGPDSSHTGSIIITGDYSQIASGLTLTLSDSQVYGIAGKQNLDGGTAIYIEASGDIKFVVNDNTIIGGGGGGGHNIELIDATGKIIESNEVYHNKTRVPNASDYISDVRDNVKSTFFDDSTQKIYGGYGAGFSEGFYDIKNYDYSFVKKPTYTKGSEGFTLIVNSVLEKQMFKNNTV